MSSISSLIDEMLATRLPPANSSWQRGACGEISAGVSDTKFASLLSLASRHCPRGDLQPTSAERQRANEVLKGWNPERWKLLEGVRVAMILAHPSLNSDGPTDAMEEAFPYADAGELCALYRSFALLPHPRRLLWQAGEGCRTNMVPVFESIACDNPYPASHFDDLAWNQLVIKTVFIAGPVWRIWGLDSRLSPELARIALDLVAEKRSAGRAIPPQLWLCLGEHAGERGIAELVGEAASGESDGRRAALLALARAGARDRLAAMEIPANEPELSQTLQQALDGHCDQTSFAGLGE